jgi:hypothetical protein
MQDFDSNSSKFVRRLLANALKNNTDTETGLLDLMKFLQVLDEER